MSATSTVLDMGFLAALMMLLLYLALIGLAVALAMRNALIYVTALLAPLVFASSVLPLFRDSARKIVHLGVALVVSKLAIVVTLTPRREDDGQRHRPHRQRRPVPGRGGSARGALRRDRVLRRRLVHADGALQAHAHRRGRHGRRRGRSAVGAAAP